MLAVSDEQLIQWVANGDKSCLGTLFERHHRAVFQYCRQLTRNTAVSEDLAQEVFIKLLKKAPSYRYQGSFKAWMFCIAHNVAFDYLRKTKRHGDFYSEDQVMNEQNIDSHSTERAASSKQQLQLVARALAEIPAAAREVIWLGRFVFDSYEELAAALNCNASAARVRMHRAMQQLNTAVTQLNGAPIDV
jgi:RNA polymerase sigma-70 factor (ECF subfamily)